MISIPTIEAQNSFPTLLAKSKTQMVSVTHRGKEVAFLMSPAVLENYVNARMNMEKHNITTLNEPHNQEAGHDEWLVAKVSKTKAMVDSGNVKLSRVDDVRLRLRKKMQDKQLTL